MRLLRLNMPKPGIHGRLFRPYQGSHRTDTVLGKVRMSSGRRRPYQNVSIVYESLIKSFHDKDIEAEHNHSFIYFFVLWSPATAMTVFMIYVFIFIIRSKCYQIKDSNFEMMITNPHDMGHIIWPICCGLYIGYQMEVPTWKFQVGNHSIF